MQRTSWMPESAGMRRLGPRRVLYLGRRGDEGVALRTLFAALILRSDSTLQHVPAIFVVLPDNRARAGDRVTGSGHSTVTHTEFREC